MGYIYAITSPNGDTIETHDANALQEWALAHDAGHLVLNMIADSTIADGTWDSLTSALEDSSGFILTREPMPSFATQR